MENCALVDELRAHTDEIAGWNHELEACVAAQLAEIERTGKLRRFLGPQLADLIVAAELAVRLDEAAAGKWTMSGDRVWRDPCPPLE